MNAAKSAGIPVIFFNREVADNSVINGYEKCAFVGTNAPDAGHMQGEMIGKLPCWRTMTPWISTATA